MHLQVYQVFAIFFAMNSMGAMDFCPTPQGSCRPSFLCFRFFTLLLRGSSSEESEAAASASFSLMSAGLTPWRNPPFLRGAHSSFNESDRSTLPKMSFTATT